MLIAAAPTFHRHPSAVIRLALLIIATRPVNICASLLLPAYICGNKQSLHATPQNAIQTHKIFVAKNLCPHNVHKSPCPKRLIFCCLIHAFITRLIVEILTHNFKNGANIKYFICCDTIDYYLLRMY